MSINKNAELLPYYERARDTLDYDHKTGLFIDKRTGRRSGYKRSDGYVLIEKVINKKTRRLLAHRIAWFIYYGELPKNTVDHIDGDPSNNRISNLRSCETQLNSLNKGFYSNNSSGYKGVTWNKTARKWKAGIGYRGEHLYLGIFDCPKEASEVYQEKAKELYGEYYNGIN